LGSTPEGQIRLDQNHQGGRDIVGQDRKHSSTGATSHPPDSPGECSTLPDASPAACPVEEGKQEEQTIPWKFLVCLLLCVASDAIALSAPLPYLPGFCQTRLGVPENEVSSFVRLRLEGLVLSLEPMCPRERGESFFILHIQGVCRV
jgi:hypothetical protein